MQPVAFASRSVMKIDLCARKTRIAGLRQSSLLKTTKGTTQDIITKREPHAIEERRRSGRACSSSSAGPNKRLALAQKLLRRRAPRVVFRKRNRVDRHAPTCAVQADLDP